MPRAHKGDFLGERWEYTLVSDEFSELDEDAKGLNPSAGTMFWKSFSYPDIAFSFSPQIQSGRINGPWWLPDDLLWASKDLLLSILSKAVILESIPVVKDYMLLNSSVEILRQETVYVPAMKKIQEDEKNQLCSLMCSLVICETNEKESRFTDIVTLLKRYKQNTDSFRIRLCLLRFPHRIWIEGLYHTRTHPVIVIPTNIHERYHGHG